MQRRFVELFALYFEKRHLLSKSLHVERAGMSSWRSDPFSFFGSYSIVGHNIVYRGKNKKKTLDPKTFLETRKLDKKELTSAIGVLKDYEYLFRILEWKGKASDVINIENSTLRREALKFYGIERFFKEMKATLIHTDGKSELLRLSWHKWEDPILMVKVIDSTTRDIYLIRVPPQMKTVRQAVAWTFHREEGEYHPAEET